ncbi:hypothetical protein [Nocardioides sp.]|uniref:hypothetical protein n=1 Tax=Nocardioides sp. TaxID=35761 RepID=UPI002B274769|nr:hypothetical protein [Nocardioides sp.]
MTAQPELPSLPGPSIAVLGATGAVGARVAAILAAMGRDVIAVSRHPGRLTATLPTRATSTRGEFTDPASIGDVPPGIAVNCTGIEDVVAVQKWRDAGWAMVDITASSRYALQLANATRIGPPLIVGVGLTPGLTSVLARHLVARDPGTNAVEISCLVGLGEDYGEASRDWTYHQLGQDIDDPTGAFRNFSDPRTIDFPGGFGRRRAWRIDFADRALLAQELNVAVITRYCFDSRLAGRALATASAVPKLPGMLRRITQQSRQAVGDTAWWAGVVETDGGRRAVAIGNGQSQGTAAVAAIAADHLIRSENTDARYLWDLIDAKELVANLGPLGVLVTIEQ